MNNERYEVGPGRTIYRDGQPIFKLSREESTSPVETDELAHEICRHLNSIRWEGPK